MRFRSYIDTQLTDSLKITRLISRPSDSDSDGDPDSPTNIALSKPIGEKLRHLPGREVRRWPSIISAVGTGSGVFNIMDGFPTGYEKRYSNGRLPGVAYAQGPLLTLT